MRRNSVSSIEEEDEGAVDLTPMLDVVFIMLIFFIVTAVFIKETGVEVNRPDASTDQPKDDTTVLVAIRADNSIWIDKRRVDVRSVRANIERLHAENPEGGLVVQADKAANVDTLIQVIDTAREVITDPTKISVATSN